MPLILGVDEAGYGPNLGPLLLATTVWEIPGDPARCDLYAEFAGIVDNAGSDPAGTRLHIADSKQVYSPGVGLGGLERGVLTSLGLLEPGPINPPATYQELVERLQLEPESGVQTLPWLDAVDLSLPVENVGVALPLLEDWRQRCRDLGIRLLGIGIDVVSPERFNLWNARTGSKGRSLSELTLRLVRRTLERVGGLNGTPALILADKHGGRNRYQEFLPLVCDDAFITCLAEGPDSSRYRAGAIEYRFETRAERHLPTALASMTAKYVRELSMRLFNRFWQNELPGLAPTAGYPLDAARFRREIRQRQQALGIPDAVLWRER